MPTPQSQVDRRVSEPWQQTNTFPVPRPLDRRYLTDSQQTPFSQTPGMHDVATSHFFPTSQGGHLPPPQSMSVSVPFWIPSVHDVSDASPSEWSTPPASPGPIDASSGGAASSLPGGG